ncbi:MAG: hypothetical protein JSR72_18795 [Proteobacteria bacterium]|nr:hypothetical protein [Pseudomonadota bacterium]
MGGVSLAISILALALIPPGGTHLLLTPREIAARGVMIERGQHPEWRQFMIQAALRRADELERLRSLPSAAVQLPEAAAPAEDKATAAESAKEEQTAGLQSAAQPATTGEVTGSINNANNDNPGATIPIDIGEASSTELPVEPAEERPPVSGVRDSRVPEPDVAAPPSVPAVETRESVLPPAKPKIRVMQRRPRHKSVRPAPQAAAKPQVPPPFSLIAAIFSSLSRPETSAAPNQQTAANGPGSAR